VEWRGSMGTDGGAEGEVGGMIFRRRWTGRILSLRVLGEGGL
jgi:hypothetical protein